MTIEDIQEICGKYPGVTEDIEWQDHLGFNIGGKMFLITAPDAVPCSAYLLLILAYHCIFHFYFR